jgi:uncharacterized membrane protein YfhO
MPHYLFNTINVPASSSEELKALKQLNNYNFNNITLTKYNPSSLEFKGDYLESDRIFGSINYNKGWKLFVDGKLSSGRIEEGPFGMLCIKPAQGMHRYNLIYKDNILFFMIGCTLLGMFALIAAIKLKWI